MQLEETCFEKLLCRCNQSSLLSVNDLAYTDMCALLSPAVIYMVMVLGGVSRPLAGCHWGLVGVVPGQALYWPPQVT